MDQSLAVMLRQFNYGNNSFIILVPGLIFLKNNSWLTFKICRNIPVLECLGFELLSLTSWDHGTVQRTLSEGGGKVWLYSSIDSIRFYQEFVFLLFVS